MHSLTARVRHLAHELDDEHGGGEVVQSIGLVALFGAILVALIAVAPALATALETLFTTTIGNITF